MKNDKTNILNKKHRLLPFLIPCLLIACSPREDQNHVGYDAPVNSPLPGQITLTQQQFQTSNMELGQMGEHSFGSTIRINGTIDVPPEGRAEISSYYGGYVRGLSLLTGQEVKKGQRLFYLDNPEYVEMQQDFLETKSQLAYLQSDYERQQTLSKENIASQKNFLRAESEYLTTLARLEGLKKKLYQLNLDPDRITPTTLTPSISIYSPISGYITAVNARNGAFLSPSDVAVSIINTKNIHLELHVFEKDIAHIEKGQSIRFSFPDARDQNYEAEVIIIGKSIEADTRMISVHAHLKDDEQNKFFTPGMYVEAEIYSTNGLSKALPENTVVEVEDQNYVLVKKEMVGDETVFEERKVEIGSRSDGLVEILNAEDFQATDEFLIKGAFNLIQ